MWYVVALCYKLEGRSWVQFLMGSLEFFLDLIPRVALWHRVNSTSDRNEYQEYLLQGKGNWRIGLTTLPPSGANCLEILRPSVSWSPKGLPRPVMG